MTTNISLPRGEIIQQMDGVYELFPVAPDQKALLAIIKTCLALMNNPLADANPSELMQKLRPGTYRPAPLTSRQASA